MEISHYYFEIDYDIFRPCENGDDCCKNDICRCGKIQNIAIKFLYMEEVVDVFKTALLGEKHEWTDVENYCFGRLFTSLKLYEPNKYKVNVVDGYYGEELDSVVCIDGWDEFEIEFKKMMELSDDDKIRFVLQKEYGYLLDVFKNASFELRLVNYSDIITPRDLKRTEGDCYDFSSATAICKQIGDKYKIIDGHHRWKKYEYYAQIYIYVPIPLGDNSSKL